MRASMPHDLDLQILGLHLQMSEEPRT